VIAGELKRRRLAAPRGLATRPSSDRLRQALFDVLGPSLAGRAFLDLYAGTGAVGIEAFSRGARPVAWVESDPSALRCLRANLAHLGIAAPASGPAPNYVVARPIPAALARLPGPWDVIFADPPYAELPQSLAALEPFARTALRPGGRFLFEARRAAPLPDPWAGLPLLRRLQVGDSIVAFYAAED